MDFQVTAICPEEKLKGYALANHLQSNGKNTIFSKLGFTQDNAFELKQLLEKQALESYKKGQYILGYLDKHGQRIRIKIAIKGYEFYSAWMVEPMGLIRLITPFGGWVNGKE